MVVCFRTVRRHRARQPLARTARARAAAGRQLAVLDRQGLDVLAADPVTGFGHDLPKR